MLKFNNDHIITGYIKQLLHSFNLPNCAVYTGDEKQLLENNIYLKNNTFQKYSKTYGWIDSKINYFDNEQVLNRTKQLKITNNIYDTYTHEYLGNYLRFLRDYKNLNLMPLYNCFSNKICNNIKLECNHLKTNSNTDSHLLLDSTDTDYKIYMLPVKYGYNYTIAIDCSEQVDLVCGIYNQYLFEDNDNNNTNKNMALAGLTHISIKNCSFNSPFLFDKLTNNSADLAEYIKNLESDLKLFIKLPIDNKSSIVVLEGDYVNYNKINKTIINFEKINNYTESNTALITPLQLLRLQTGESYPFSDTLISYLVGNAITSEDQNADNIKRVQSIMKKNNQHYAQSGLWDDEMRLRLYSYMTQDNGGLIEDNLGYVDNNIEQKYKYVSKKDNSSINIAQVDIYD